MMQPLTEDLVHAARAAAQTDAWERDQVAWNLPGRTDDASPSSTSLDWVGFSEAFYPGSRRHDLAAIAAYAAYKRTNSDV